ncbi:MAG TPA: hypothetical protein VGF48_22970 [Thermoanaerobaculia bacterium]
MINLGALDTLIAMVVTILLLSMIVQSLQTFLKKLLKFKSKQIEKSLQHLFDQVNATAPPPDKAATASDVLEQFGKMGRHTMGGGNAVESISKVDLSKVVVSIEGSALVPAPAKESIVAFFLALKNARDTVEALAAIQLPNTALAQLTDLRTRVAPFVAHVEALFDQQGNLDSKVIVRDVLSLRDFPAQDVVAVAAALQAQVEQAALAEPNNPDLQKAAAAAKALSQSIGQVQVALTRAVARLRERIDAIETWYDTVMQGFEERYARHMRSFAFFISLAVAIICNADIIHLYKRLATDDVAKQRILTQSDTIQKQYAARMTAPDVQPQTVQQLRSQMNAELDELTLTYPAMGLEPFNYTGFRWYTPIGWLIMAFLLSLGAPFWQDTLESLFALKNLLRQKGQIKNVEQGSGQGQPKG